ncbi:MAG: manganese-binding transcriptional regulator MntR [Chthonomonas sp.]|nr:manganese-binding transcriptional regulator MntR [Chthonomonas sp.]
MAENRFVRTRNDHSQETAEDYAELVFELRAEFGLARITDIAARMSVSNATAAKVLVRLEREGLVTLPPRKGVHLTPTGESLALKCKARHDVVVEFLRALGVPPPAAEVDAEGMEHHVGEATLGAMRKFLAGRS